jgi:eukaryotic-like serine/threonine-protein kinase
LLPALDFTPGVLPVTKTSTSNWLRRAQRPSPILNRTAQPLSHLGLRDEIFANYRDLDWIVMKCLEKDRTRRYETANVLALDILRHLNSEAVVARPPSAVYLFRKFAHRNKLPLAAAVGVAVSLIIGLAVLTLMFFKEKAARERAVFAEKAEIRSRQMAESNAKEAETEAKKSQQVAQFLKETLEGVSPWVGLGRDTTLLREILDHSADRISQKLRGQPEVEAELRSSIGEAYRNFGAYEKAEAMHRRALVIRRKLFGAEHLAVAQSLDELGVVLWLQEEPAEAVTLLREALALRTKLLGK